MASTLERLFAYARTSESDPRENFTTEALAAAVRSDPGPLLLILARKGVLDPHEVVRCAAFTQVSFAGAGTIDLLLQLELPTAAREVWIEIKVRAPESGEQLRNYRKFIDARSTDLRRDLIVLARDILPSDVQHTDVRWREVAHAAREVAPKNLLWSDLVVYLEEIGMTDQSTYPVTLREASSLDDAFALFRKAFVVIEAVNRHIPDLGYPDWLHTKTRGWVTSKLHDQFIRFGRFVINSKRELRGQIFYGYVPRDGEAYATVWIEVDPRRTIERQAVRELADLALDASWERPLDNRWQLVIKAERVIVFRTERDATEWFLARFEELRAVGLIDLLPTLGAVPLEEQEPEMDSADDATLAPGGSR